MSLRQYNKWYSRRWWICLWAIIMATIIIFWLMISGIDAPSWVGVVLGLFQVIISIYIAADSMTKPKEKE